MNSRELESPLSRSQFNQADIVKVRRNPSDLTDPEWVSELGRLGSSTLRSRYHRYGRDPEFKQRFPTYYSFRIEIAARAQLGFLQETVSAQIEQVLTQPKDSLIHQLASWGPLTGLTFKNESDLNLFLLFFEAIPHVPDDEEIKIQTQGRVDYGLVFREMILKRLIQPGSNSLADQTQAIKEVIKSWRGLALLPSTVIRQALWKIPDPEATLLTNIPALCQKISDSLDNQADWSSNQPVTKAQAEIKDTLNETMVFFSQLKALGWETHRNQLPHSFEPMAVPLEMIIKESLVGASELPARESANLYQDVSQKTLNAFLIGEFGYDKKTLEGLISLGFTQPDLTPWFLLELQKRGLCQIREDYYQNLPLDQVAWQNHFRQLQALGIASEVDWPVEAKTIYDLHQDILRQACPPIKVDENSIVFCLPGKYWPPHLRHGMLAITAAKVVKDYFPGACVMVSPNWDDPKYHEMRPDFPANERKRLLETALTGVENIFVALAGQTCKVKGNENKFGPTGNFGRFLQKLFHLPNPPTVGFVGGLEKFDSIMAGQLPLMPAVLFPRAEDLTNMPKAIDKMRQVFAILGSQGAAIVLLPGLEINGTRIRRELQSDYPSPKRLGSWLHPGILLALAEKYPLHREVLIQAAGVGQL